MCHEEIFTDCPLWHSIFMYIHTFVTYYIGLLRTFMRAGTHADPSLIGFTHLNAPLLNNTYIRTLENGVTHLFIIAQLRQHIIFKKNKCSFSNATLFVAAFALLPRHYVTTNTLDNPINP